MYGHIYYSSKEQHFLPINNKKKMVINGGPIDLEQQNLIEYQESFRV